MNNAYEEYLTYLLEDHQGKLGQFLRSAAFQTQGHVFGRRMYEVEELLPFIPRIFKHLRRCHHNRVKQQYRTALELIVAPVELRAITDEWMSKQYSHSALKLAYYEEFLTYLLEDHRVRPLSVERSRTVSFTAGGSRAFHEQGVSIPHRSLIPPLMGDPEPVFGRRMYEVEELVPFIPRVFKHLRRCYHNQVKLQYRAALEMVTDRETLGAIFNHWAAAEYSDSAMSLVYVRTMELEMELGARQML
ncbi:hypothetical protein DFH09DRAFT_1435803 [Mycena vulgaris]|nr:hypothetical protein DFH09DRAFT_1435803 [Mycena vulgaris]